MPEKIYYKMGEVCELTELEPHVLRFWESEFPQLKPQKNRANHRIFSRDDLDLVLKIKKLLYEQGYTIAGALKKLEHINAEENNRPEPLIRKQTLLAQINEIKANLNSALKMLDED